MTISFFNFEPFKTCISLLGVLDKRSDDGTCSESCCQLSKADFEVAKLGASFLQALSVDKTKAGLVPAFLRLS